MGHGNVVRKKVFFLPLQSEGSMRSIRLDKTEPEAFGVDKVLSKGIEKSVRLQFW